MREWALWGTAALFLLVAVYTVTVRRELYNAARDIGRLEERLLHCRRLNDNLELERERLASPATLLRETDGESR